MPTQEQLASQAAEALREQSKIVQALQEQTKIAQSQADQMDPEYLRKFNEGEIKASKQFRVDLDAVLQRLKASPRFTSSFDCGHKTARGNYVDRYGLEGA